MAATGALSNESVHFINSLCPVIMVFLYLINTGYCESIRDRKKNAFDFSNERKCFPRLARFSNIKQDGASLVRECNREDR